MTLSWMAVGAIVSCVALVSAACVKIFYSPKKQGFSDIEQNEIRAKLLTCSLELENLKSRYQEVTQRLDRFETKLDKAIEALTKWLVNK